MAELTADMVEPLAAGASFLGTGGGGDPYIGAILCREALGRYGPVELLDLDRVPEDAAVFTVAAMGAPTILVEKLLSLEDADVAVRALERHLGRAATAIIAAEVGGVNSTLPIAYAAMRGLPLIDADGMGRAFPSLQMTTFNVGGVGCTPLALADEFGDHVVMRTGTALRAEELARPVVTSMGASATLSCYPMTGAQARATAVGGSISAALAVGRALATGYGDADPVGRLLSCLEGESLYGWARRLFEGKIVGLERDTSRGWVFGACQLAALDGRGECLIRFQNENLSVEVDGVLRAVVPDLITIVDRETGSAIPTESLRYGQRVAVIGTRAPAALRTAAAMTWMGPAAFGLAHPYRPIEEIALTQS